MPVSFRSERMSRREDRAPRRAMPCVSLSMDPTVVPTAVNTHTNSMSSHRHKPDTPPLPRAGHGAALPKGVKIGLIAIGWKRK